MKFRMRTQEPDARDVRAVVDEIEKEFGHLVRFDVTYTQEDVVVIGRCYRPDVFNGEAVTVQALSRRRLSDKRPRDTQMFSVAWDLYQQLDTGILGFKGREY